MSLFALASGAIFRSVEIRRSKNGRAFATATLKVRDGDAVSWVRVLAFSDHAIEALQRLNDGDGVAVQGVLKSEVLHVDARWRDSSSVDDPRRPGCTAARAATPTKAKAERRNVPAPGQCLSARRRAQPRRRRSRRRRTVLRARE